MHYYDYRINFLTVKILIFIVFLAPMGPNSSEFQVKVYFTS